MSDTLQLVVNVPNTQHYKNKATFQALNEYPIRFSVSSTFPTFTIPEIGQRMSDTLQLVVDVPNTQHYKNKATFQALGFADFGI